MVTDLILYQPVKPRAPPLAHETFAPIIPIDPILLAPPTNHQHGMSETLETRTVPVAPSAAGFGTESVMQPDGDDDDIEWPADSLFEQFAEARGHSVDFMRRLWSMLDGPLPRIFSSTTSTAKDAILREHHLQRTRQRAKDVYDYKFPAGVSE